MKEVSNQNKKVLKDTLFHVIATVVLGLVISFIISSLLKVSLFDWDWDSYQENLATQVTIIYWLEIGFIFMIYLWLASFLRSKWGAASLFLTISVSLAIANQQKLLIRGEPIYPSDFEMIKVLPEIMRMINLKIAIFSLFFVLTMVIITLWLIRKDWSSKRSSQNSILRWLSVISFVATSVGLVMIYNFNQPGNVVRATFDPHVKWIHWSQQENYRQNGFISGILFNLPGQSIKKPDNYSSETVEDIVTRYTDIARTENEKIEDQNKRNPNIIFIMNESFSDPKNLEKISLSADPIPYFDNLSEEYLGGNVLISGYGGGTANAEFEALTSISLEPLSSNISTPYIQMNHLMNRTPNIVSQLKDKGYRTTAIHPYNTTMYKRPDVYSALGFDELIYDETMGSLEYHENNGYVSDLSAYQEVLDQMKQTEENDFIHVVTMHGHKSYNDKYEELMFQVEEENNNENIEVLEQYYQGLAYSDQDFNYFIEQIDLMEEDTLVVFWGDHLPGIYTNEIFAKQHKIDMYETPVLFYANYENEGLEGSINLTAPFYFRNTVSSILNDRISGYMALMKEMEEQLPAFKRGLYVEAFTDSIVTDRNKLTEKSQEILEYYDMILYDLFEGNQQAAKLDFFEIPEESNISS